MSAQALPQTQPCRLAQNPQGQWVWFAANGQSHTGAVVVRAYPVTAPDAGVGVMSAEGQELAWFEQLNAVPQPLQSQLRQAICAREFLPEIEQLKTVSSWVTPTVWTVQTNRGTTQFMLKGEEDIRRLTGKVLLVSDADGVQYLIRDTAKLDRHSRKLLDRFM